MEILRELAHGFRVLAKRPAFTAAALLALGFAIGANTTILTLFDAIALRPLPYGDPDRLVILREYRKTDRGALGDVSPVQFVDFRSSIASFEGVAGWWFPDLNLTGNDREPERASAVDVTDDFFDVMGVALPLGRGFLPGEDRSGSSPVVVISHRLWTSRYGSDPGIVGEDIYLDGRPERVVGVAPPGFRFPRRSDVWRPLGWDPALHNRGARFFGVVARLAAEASLDEAQSELDVLTRRLEAEFPATNRGWAARAIPLLHSELGRVREGLLVLLGAVGLVLLLACANVANLLMAQAVGRDQEVAVRVALGAGRARLLRQFLIESFTLALVGGALGLALAFQGVALAKRIAPAAVPRLEEASIDARVLGFTVLVVAVTALVFGSFPAWRMSRGLGQGTRVTSPRTRDAFVVAQVAIAALLLIGAGLLTRGFERLIAEDPGFDPLGTVTFNLQLPSTIYEEWPDVSRFYGELLDRLRSVPGVERAAATAFLPLQPGWEVPFTVKGRTPLPEPERPQAQYHTVSPGYFRAMGIPLLRGRDFDARDWWDRPGVVIVNEAARRRFWPDEDPVGAVLETTARQFGPLGRVLPESLDMEVVGLVADVKNEALDAETEPALYFPMGQFAYRSMNVVLRSSAAVETLAPRVEAEVWRLDPDLPVYRFRALEEELTDAVAEDRFVMTVLGAFAGLALLLAAVGTYGVISYAAAERRREIGIRLALGARPLSLLFAFVRQGLALAAMGVAVGAGAAWFVGRLLGSQLREVSVGDPLVFGLVAVVLLAAAGLASLAPARRASRIDPWATLRVE